MSNTETIKINRKELNIQESLLELERQSYASLQQMLSIYILCRNETIYGALTDANRSYRNAVNNRKSTRKLLGLQ